MSWWIDRVRQVLRVALGYLHPPPSPAPVVVQKDVGGLVSEYQAITEMYRRENREVRLHECRSACTLALSLPNVCVYPSSVLKFHSAYHRDTKEIDQSISSQLFNAYPEAVRERLGYLTRQYRSLSGRELIDLGVRDCTKPANETMIARARARQVPTQVASANIGSNPLGSVLDGVKGFFGGSQQPTAVSPPQGFASPAITAAVSPMDVKAPDVPLPPPRPADLVEDKPANVQVAANVPARTASDATVARGFDAPRPIRLPRMIIGAAPILPPMFSAYAALR
ncbi:MAG: hypothetical protein JWN93_2904 [Hyphomicrobiales bacterium]|nr:hypothetical protein [Hyphomicrobiales bacterium]